MKTHSSKFDFSEYPKSRPIYFETNKRVLRKFKDELNKEAAYQFVGLKQKMYSMKSLQAEKKKKPRGYFVARKMWMVYSITGQLMNSRKDFRHRLFTLGQRNKCLSSFEDKRYVLEDGVSSLAYGPCKIKKLKKKIQRKNFKISESSLNKYRCV